MTFQPITAAFARHWPGALPRGRRWYWVSAVEYMPQWAGVWLVRVDCRGSSG